MDNKKRTTIQGIAALLQNANIKGFLEGKIYQGPGKAVCVPGLNCYSCPAAIGSCPIGSLQNSLSSYSFKIPYYVVGLLLFFATLFGRLICGFLCPFGLVQDLINMIPFPKKIKTFGVDKYLRYLKYVVLIVFVIILPICVKLTPFFCKYLCPSGTLAGILLAFSDTTLFSVLGSRFVWKVSILGMIILFSLLIYRPFCKYLCPLGAIYGMFNKYSLVKLHVDKSKCIGCGQCAQVCKMCVNPVQNSNHSECIRCGICTQNCPEKAIHIGIKA